MGLIAPLGKLDLRLTHASASDWLSDADDVGFTRDKVPQVTALIRLRALGQPQGHPRHAPHNATNALTTAAQALTIAVMSFTFIASRLSAAQVRPSV